MPQFFPLGQVIDAGECAHALRMIGGNSKSAPPPCSYGLFKCRCDYAERKAIGYGRRKRDAKQLAAREMLKQCGQDVQSGFCKEESAAAAASARDDDSDARSAHERLRFLLRRLLWPPPVECEMPVSPGGLYRTQMSVRGQADKGEWVEHHAVVSHRTGILFSLLHVGPFRKICHRGGVDII